MRHSSLMSNAPVYPPHTPDLKATSSKKKMLLRYTCGGDVPTTSSDDKCTMALESYEEPACVSTALNTTMEEEDTITALLLSTLRMIAESPLTLASTAEPDAGLSSTTSSISSFEHDLDTYSKGVTSSISKMLMDTEDLVPRSSETICERNVLLSATSLPCLSLRNSLLSYTAPSCSPFGYGMDPLCKAIHPPSDLSLKRNALFSTEFNNWFAEPSFMKTSELSSISFYCREDRDYEDQIQFLQQHLDMKPMPYRDVCDTVDASQRNAKESTQHRSHTLSTQLPDTFNTERKKKELYESATSVETPFHSIQHRLNLKLQRPGCGPTYWGMWEDERSRMVYVSWLPRAARANDRTKKKQCEVHLKHFISNVLGFSGLLKVLLFPPSSAHCKLLFVSEPTARCFLETFGTMKHSRGAELWKSLVCQHFRVSIRYGINATQVRIIWADQTKTDSEVLAGGALQ